MDQILKLYKGGVPKNPACCLREDVWSEHHAAPLEDVCVHVSCAMCPEQPHEFTHSTSLSGPRTDSTVFFFVVEFLDRTFHVRSRYETMLSIEANNNCSRNKGRKDYVEMNSANKSGK